MHNLLFSSNYFAVLVRCAVLFLVFTVNGVTAQTLKGNLTELAGQTIVLEGYRGAKNYTIANVKANAKGVFTIPYNTTHYGVATLQTAAGNNFPVLLNGETIELKGKNLTNVKDIKVLQGKQNALFAQYNYEQSLRDQAITGWAFLDDLYYKEAFLKNLCQSYKKGEIDYHLTYEQIELELKSKEWVVNNAWPTENTEVIESYLSKYINRSAVSKKRLTYNSNNGEVEIVYKDYKNQKQGEAASYKSKKIKPLVAIHQIVQHKLPPYYHRVRYYGLHHSSVERKLKPIIDQRLVGNKDSVKILFELLSKMLRQQSKTKKRACPNCGHDQFYCEKQAGDQRWAYANIVGYCSNKSPPQKVGSL